jgi:hypothetical protein
MRCSQNYDIGVRGSRPVPTKAGVDPVARATGFTPGSEGISIRP